MKTPFLLRRTLRLYPQKAAAMQQKKRCTPPLATALPPDTLCLATSLDRRLPMAAIRQSLPDFYRHSPATMR